jgi:hypothetical protein
MHTADAVVKGTERPCSSRRGGLAFSALLDSYLSQINLSRRRGADPARCDLSGDLLDARHITYIGRARASAMTYLISAHPVFANLRV